MRQLLGTGYMNVFDSADGGFCNLDLGWSRWILEIYRQQLVASDITLQPNFNAYAENVGGTDGDIVTGRIFDGGVTAGPTGNKLMEASTFVEPRAYV